MNIENQTQYILLGAVLTFSEYADVLQDLKIDDFCPELHDTFAAIRGYWEHNDKWNPVEVMGRYDNCKKAMGECLDAFGAEFIRNVTHDMMLGWARIVKEQAALSRAREIAFKIVDGSTRYADLTGIYEQLGEAINLHNERSDFIPMCDGIDNYIRKLDDKPEYISTGLRVLDNNLHLVPGNFVVIGGRPSAGKTALSLQLACEIAKSGRKVVYFSLETDPDTLYARVIASPSECKPKWFSSTIYSLSIKPERKTDTVPSRRSAWHCMSSHSPQERWWSLLHSSIERPQEQASHRLPQTYERADRLSRTQMQSSCWHRT